MATSDPFNDSEKAMLLKEIIASSNLSPPALASIIHDFQIHPSWDDIRMPTGRTMRQCQKVFQEIMSSSSPYRPHLVTDPRVQQTSMHPPRHSMPPEASLTGGRTIQPRPPHMSIFTSESPSSPYSPTSSENQARRRGRPNRAEAERRKRRKEEAAARGEKDPYPSRPRKKQKAAQPAAEPDAPSAAPPPPPPPPPTALSVGTTTAGPSVSMPGFTAFNTPRSLPPSSSSPGPTLAPILSTAPPGIGGTYGRAAPEQLAPTSRPGPSGFPPPARPPSTTQYELPPSSFPPAHP